MRPPCRRSAGRSSSSGRTAARRSSIEVLSTQDVEASIKPGETFVKEMESFVTSYDSDNKGVGNVGGSQYVGYLLVLLE